MCDPQTVIEKVRGHPILYDLSDKDYKNVKKKDKIWREIAESVGVESGDEIKRKWKNLRDSYNKYLRANSTTGENLKSLERYKSWPWVEQMDFLRPSLGLGSVEESVNQQNNDHNETPIKYKIHSKKKIKKEGKESQPSTQDRVLTSGEKTNRYWGSDPIDDIFRGYAKTVKTFSKKRQAIVKFQISQLLMDAELEQVEEDEKEVDGATSHVYSNSNVCEPTFAYYE